MLAGWLKLPFAMLRYRFPDVVFPLSGFFMTGCRLLYTALLLIALSGCGTIHVREQTTLVSAATIGDAATVTHLLGSGTSPDTSLKDGTTALFMAAQQGHTQVVKLLLNAGANVNQGYKSATPLIIAATEGHKDIVSLLLKKGANVNVSRDDGATALYMASQSGYIDIVRQLLSSGAEVDKHAYKNATALFIAAQLGHHTIVKALLDKGANINEALPDGTTPLIAAALKGHVSVVYILLPRGADITRKNRQGQDALQAARQGAYPELVSILQKASTRAQPGKSVIRTEKPARATVDAASVDGRSRPSQQATAAVPAVVVKPAPSTMVSADASRSASVPSVSELIRRQQGGVAGIFSGAGSYDQAEVIENAPPLETTPLPAQHEESLSAKVPAVSKPDRVTAVVQQDHSVTGGNQAPASAAVSVAATDLPAADEDDFEVEDSDFNDDPSAFGWSAEKFLRSVDAATRDELHNIGQNAQAVDRADQALSQTLAQAAQQLARHTDASYLYSLESEAGSVKQQAPENKTQTEQNQPGKDQRVAAVSQPVSGQLDGLIRERYRSALLLIREKQYAKGSKALEAFLVTYPDAALTPDALYWLGVAAYSQADYKQAASQFLSLYKRYPEHAKTPDGLLNLGRSLLALGKNKAACATFSKLKTQYSVAWPRLTDGANRASARAQCP